MPVPPAVQQLIGSADNPAFRRLSALLTSTRARREEGVAVLEGAHLLAAWMDRPGSIIDTVFVHQESVDVPPMTSLLARAAGARVLVCAPRLFHKASPVAGENGVLAIIPVPMPSAAPVVPGRFELWLDHVQDPGNVGTLIRSAAGAGAAAVRLGHGCADGWSPKCLRAGMGGHFVLELEERCDLLARAEHGAVQVIGADGQAEVSVFDADLTGTFALLLGGEGAGISADLQRQVTQRLRIPMPGRIESLNVAAAGAIICFERVRQLSGAVARKPP